MGSSQQTSHVDHDAFHVPVVIGDTTFDVCTADIVFIEIADKQECFSGLIVTIQKASSPDHFQSR